MTACKDRCRFDSSAISVLHRLLIQTRGTVKETFLLFGHVLLQVPSETESNELQQLSGAVLQLQHTRLQKFQADLPLWRTFWKLLQELRSNSDLAFLLSLHTTDMQQHCPSKNTTNCNATVGARRTSHKQHPRNLLDLHTGTSKSLSMNSGWGISMVRRTAWTMGNRLCATTQTTITVSSNWGISLARQRSGPWETASAPRQRRRPARPVQQGHRSPCRGALEKFYGPQNSLERQLGNPRGDCLCNTTGEDGDDVDELPLRNLHSFLHVQRHLGNSGVERHPASVLRHVQINVATYTPKTRRAQYNTELARCCRSQKPTHSG